MQMSWPDYAEREGRESGGSMYLAHDILSRDKAGWLRTRCNVSLMRAEAGM